jgi:hypothetical protein
VYGGAYAWQDGEIVEAVPGGPYMLVESGVEHAIKSGIDSPIFGDGLKPYGLRGKLGAGHPLLLPSPQKNTVIVRRRLQDLDLPKPTKEMKGI